MFQQPACVRVSILIQTAHCIFFSFPCNRCFIFNCIVFFFFSKFSVLNSLFSFGLEYKHPSPITHNAKRGVRSEVATVDVLCSVSCTGLTLGRHQSSTFSLCRGRPLSCRRWEESEVPQQHTQTLMLDPLWAQCQCSDHTGWCSQDWCHT